MTFLRRAAREGAWFAGFKFVTQGFSWAITVVVARILVPADYGLMGMASILTGYVEIFNELGLGAAIIQAKEIEEDALSSVFWLSVAVGIVFSAVSYGLAYPTAWLFDEPRVVPITQLISVLFLVSSMMIVPYSLMMRQVRFKETGMIQMVAVGVSSLAMLGMARAGFGVWTLIGGVIVQRCITLVLTFRRCGWVPALHFRLAEARPLLRYGIDVAGSRSAFYLFQKADRLIVGKVFDATALGYYSLAKQLASMPTEKIVSVINQVSFPVFSRYQDDIPRIRELYVRMTRYVLLVVAPMFVAGAIFGREIIVGFLGAKWLPLVPLFQMFCIAQLAESLTTLNGVLHNAQGRPRWNMVYTLVTTALMSAALVVASTRGLNYLGIPWVAVFPLAAVGWTVVTLRKLEVGTGSFFATCARPTLAVCGITALVWALQVLLFPLGIRPQHATLAATAMLAGCGLLYLGYLYRYERDALEFLGRLRAK
jgi:O-antigen/teichoic acid export membrane protein